MDFQQVSNYIKENDDGNDSSVSLDSSQYYEHRAPYSFQETTSVKPTFTGIVNRMLQQNSKTKLVKDYKKLANEPDELTRDQDNFLTDNASYIIDPISSPKQKQPLTQEPESLVDEDASITAIPPSSSKKPMKRVYINEEANQIQEEIEHHDDDEEEAEEEENNDDRVGHSMQHPLDVDTSLSSDRYITLDEAIVHIQQNIGNMEDEIIKQKKRIEVSIQRIKEYSDSLDTMKNQENATIELLEIIQKERIPEMIMQKTRIKESKAAMMNARKQNHLRKRGFEKYRQRISLENRLSEIRKQIQTIVKRDEIWIGIRDWGVITVLILAIIIAFILNWQG